MLEGSSDVRLPSLGQVCARGRVVTGFGEAFFGGFDAGFELFEFGGFGAEGLLSVGREVAVSLSSFVRLV